MISLFSSLKSTTSSSNTSTLERKTLSIQRIRRGYFARRESGGRNLVEQRLEGAAILPVNDRNLNGELSDPASRR